MPERQESSYDAVVLGAGLAGSAAAKALADLGWRTALIERRRLPRHKVCGAFLSPESAELLDALGLGGVTAELGASRIERAVLTMPGGRPIELALPAPAAGLSRYALDAALQAAAVRSGARLLQGSVRRVATAGEWGWRVEADYGGERLALRSRVVVEARGAGAGEASSGPARQLGLGAHYEGLTRGGAVEMYFFRGGYLGLCPVEDGRYNMAALLTASELWRQGGDALGMLHAAAARHPRLQARLAGGRPVAGTLSAVVVPRYRAGIRAASDGCLRIGDAAARIPPLCGDGMSMALRAAQLVVRETDRYLRGAPGAGRWARAYRAYDAALHRELAPALRWGLALHVALGSETGRRVAPALARLLPGTAQRLVLATRVRMRELSQR
ncbi:FAD-dependent monooxygenase [Paenibacillus sp. IB182496]|uniref:FAD-dependent monooxygenase n=1 Tax=Paenibacillus sabuli TaxID=2772509 RepID=A0A927GTV8_9BACL|nr:FAD-dependent monooxygenase [Paenibacillus sabuli]MBD2847711.1 FAD-dependent monooxygenase [Paenibacillus sabuli]